MKNTFAVFMIWISLMALGFPQGTTSGELLKLPAGAGLYGTDFFSATGNASSFMAFFHPATLSDIHQIQVGTFYSNLAFDVHYLNLMAVLPLSRRWNVALGYRQISIGGIPRFDQVGQPSGEIDAGSYDIPLTISANVNKHFSLGLQISYLSSILDNYSDGTFSFSGGMTIRDPGMQGLQISFSLLNAGQGLTFYQYTEKLPLAYAMAVQYVSSSYPVAFFTQWLKFRDEKSRIFFGGEYQLYSAFFLRGGYQISDVEEEGYHLGLGIRYGKFAISYDFIPSSSLQNRHGISVILSAPPRKTYGEKSSDRTTVKRAETRIPPPSNFSYQVVGDKLILSWDYSLLDYPGAMFEIFVSRSPDGPYLKLPFEKLQTRSVEFNPQAKTYTLYFKIRAIVDGQAGPYTPPLKVSVK